MNIFYLTLICFAHAIEFSSVSGTPYNVSYDHRAFKINGHRVLIQSGSQRAAYLLVWDDEYHFRLSTFRRDSLSKVNSIDVASFDGAE